MTEPAPSRRILVVDGDGTHRAMINAALPPQGFDVVAAHSVGEALREIAADNFDVLVTHLPARNTAIVQEAFYEQHQIPHPKGIALIVPSTSEANLPWSLVGLRTRAINYFSRWMDHPPW